MLSSHTMLQQLPLFSSSFIITAGCLSLFKLFHTVLRNKNYKNYFDFTLNVSTGLSSTPQVSGQQVPSKTVTNHFLFIDLTLAA